MGLNPANANEAMRTLEARWPGDVPAPATFEVVMDKWAILDDGLSEAKIDYDHGPVAVVRMPNGAKLDIERIDPYDQRSRFEQFSGGWDEYTDGDFDARDALSDVLSAVFITLVPGEDRS